MVGLHPVRGLLSKTPAQQTAGGGFNSYSAGNKAYGSGRPAPNMGATANMTGYAKRDGQVAARRDAYLERMKRF